MRTSCGGSPSISSQRQVDAAAQVGEDDGFDGGGGGAREKQEGRVKDLGRPIYKGRLTERVRKTRR